MGQYVTMKLASLALLVSTATSGCVAFSDSDFTINVDGKTIRHKINADLSCEPSREMWVNEGEVHDYFLGSPYDARLNFHSFTDGINSASSGMGRVDCGWQIGDPSYIDEFHQQSYQDNLDLVLKNIPPEEKKKLDEIKEWE